MDCAVYLIIPLLPTFGEADVMAVEETLQILLPILTLELGLTTLPPKTREKSLSDVCPPIIGSLKSSIITKADKVYSVDAKIVPPYLYLTALLSTYFTQLVNPIAQLKDS